MSEAKKRFTAQERVLILYMAVSHGLSHFAILVFPGLMIAVEAELQVGLARLGDYAGLPALLYGAGGLATGPLHDRYGARKLFYVCCFATALGFVWMGVSTPATLPAALALVGLGASIYHPTGVPVVTTNVVRAMGYHGVGGSAGIALYPIICMSLTEIFGWRGACFAIAVPYAVMGCLLPFVTWKEANRPPAAAPAASASSRTHTWILLVVLLTVVNVLFNFVERAFTTFIMFFAHSNPDAGLAGIRGYHVGLTATAILACGAVGQLVGGRLANTERRQGMLQLLLLSGAILVLGLSLEGLLSYAIAGLFAVALYAFQPLANTIVSKDFAPAHRRGIVFGTYSATGFLLSFVGASAGARLVLHYGTQSVGVACALTLLLASGVWFARGFVARPRLQASPAEATG